ncbi:MAG: CAP domain-containing protein [Bacteroidota bacterium]
MQHLHAFVRMGALLLGLSGSAPQLLAADFNGADLHALYRSGDYFECYRASAEAARIYPQAALPHFYAALALTRGKKDLRLQRQVHNPYSKALHYLEKAREVDPAGQQLSDVTRGLALVQRVLVRKASAAFRKGHPNIRSFFDRLAAVFDAREGIWKNNFHHGRLLVEEDYDFPAWDNPFYRLADTGRDLPGIDPEARKIIYLHNLCRMNPRLFLDTYVRQFVGPGFDDPADSYLQSLIREFRDAQAQAPYYPDAGLTLSADYHAKDLHRNDIFGHTSSDGTACARRIDRIAGRRNRIGENCAAGHNTPIHCFIDLLIDRGVPSLGHRRAIMDPYHRHIGVGIYDSVGRWKVWVFDFSE